MSGQITAWRRDIHQHPELRFTEFRTAGIVAETLQSLGMGVKTGVGKTGVTGLLRGTADAPVVLLRFDMDALPIQEETPVEYASKTPGVMHACGHDNHVAILMGVAQTLVALVKRLLLDAQLAIDANVHSIRHWIGAFLVDLGGLDALVFTAGIGENDARSRGWPA